VIEGDDEDENDGSDSDAPVAKDTGRAKVNSTDNKPLGKNKRKFTAVADSGDVDHFDVVEGKGRSKYLRNLTVSSDVDDSDMGEDKGKGKDTSSKQARSTTTIHLKQSPSKHASTPIQDKAQYDLSQATVPMHWVARNQWKVQCRCQAPNVGRIEPNL
jgi:hypothetical protein